MENADPSTALRSGMDGARKKAKMLEEIRPLKA
jgi:hypothetical protein